jgi:chromosome transmission fidelity protein 8
MKRVWMYIGGTQRLQGEVKKLPKPVAVVRRRGCRGDGDGKESGNGEEGGDVQELEVVEIVKWQVVFRSRPEPVVEGIEL